MKTNFLAGIFLTTILIVNPSSLFSQKSIKVKNFPESLPKIELDEKTPQRYLMTAEYFNKDIYGNPGSKIKVTGEYTRGLDSGYVCWNNAFIAQANSPSESYQERMRQDYMENLKYIPSSHLMEESFFKNFPIHIQNVFSRNLVWDMMAIEGYAWNYFDSLQLDKTYVIPDIQGTFEMADIGTYNHTNIELNWIGIAMKNNKLCAIIEYRALDNKLELRSDKMKSKGSEFYWGKTWLSMENKQIEYAEMYSNTVQEMEIEGLPDKLLASTKRILKVERIK
jgi:hypothetical protein